MSTHIPVGARVRLLGLPHWLIHDLPEDEQEEMRSFVGKVTTVKEIDAWGYYWVWFRFIDDETRCSTCHDFAITADFLEPADARRKRARGRLRERQRRRRRKRK